MLIDSNIIIYASKPGHTNIIDFIARHTPYVSVVSYVEVLGYHQLTQEEREHFEAFFAVAPLLSLSKAVLDEAVKLRQTKKMTLGDAIIAGTAIVYNLSLVTRNTKDFEWISSLSLINPFSEISA